jgi:ubiquinone/menaquinone biosynthesis C-methylase UbiE
MNLDPISSSSAAMSQGLEIFQQWDMYDRIVDGNWMRHRELWEATDKVVLAAQRSIHVLDVGSGDGVMAFGGLQNHPIESYVALDLSLDALDRMKAKPGPGTAGGQCQRRAIHGDFTQTVNDQPAHHFDVVLCSFSLHHLKLDGKRTMLRDLFGVIASGGQLVWIDTYLGETESRDEFLQRLEKIMLRDWVTLTPEERKAAVDHIWSSDFPESEPQMEQLLMETGFLNPHRIWSDDLFCMWEARVPEA